MACARFARPMGVFWRRSHWAKVARVWSSTSRRMADLRPCIVPSSRVWDRSYGRSVCTCPVFPPLFNGGLYLVYLDPQGTGIRQQYPKPWSLTPLLDESLKCTRWAAGALWWHPERRRNVKRKQFLHGPPVLSDGGGHGRSAG